MKRIGIYILFSLLLSLVSCVKYFEIKGAGERKITVNCLLISGDLPVVTVKFSYLSGDSLIIDQDNDSENLMIKDATVIIKDKSDGVEHVLSYSDSIIYNGFVLRGYTSLSFLPEEGKTYELIVYYADYDTVYATTTLPYSPVIDTFFVEKVDDLNDKQVNIVIADSIGQDYYWMSAFNNFYTQDPYALQFGQNLFLPDSAFDGLKYTLGLNSDKYLQKIFFYKANKDLALYMETLYKQESGRNFEDFPNPFQEPVIVYTNIKNGLGIFAGLSKPVIINL